MAGEFNTLGHVWIVNGKPVTPRTDEDVLELIRDQGGTVEGICTYCANVNEYLIATMRVEDVDKYALKQAVRNMGYKVIDIR